MTDTRVNPNSIYHIPGQSAETASPAPVFSSALAPVVSPMEFNSAPPSQESVHPVQSPAEGREAGFIEPGYNAQRAANYVVAREAAIDAERAMLETVFAASAAENPIESRAEPIAPAAEVRPVVPAQRTPEKPANPNWVTGTEAAARAVEYGIRIIHMDRRPELQQQNTEYTL